MPSLLLKNIDASLLREINYAAAKAELTQRDWVISVLCMEVGIAAIQIKVPSNDQGSSEAALEQGSNGGSGLAGEGISSADVGNGQNASKTGPPIPVPSAVPKAVGKPRVPACTRCGENKGVVEWGPMSWHCNPCHINFPRAR